MALPVAALAAIIAVAAAVAIAATVFAIYKIWKNKKKDKDQGNGEDKNKKEEKEKGKGKEDDRGKSVSSEKPKTITRKINGKDVVATLGKDGNYHIKASQIVTRKGLQDGGLTSIKNSTNTSINTAVQKQEDVNKKISELCKELDATKAKLAKKQQPDLQADQIAKAISEAAPSVIDSMFSKLNNFEFIPSLNAAPLTTMNTTNKVNNKEDNLLAAPMPKEDLMNKGEKEVKKGSATINTEVINKTKEAEQGNILGL